MPTLAINTKQYGEKTLDHSTIVKVMQGTKSPYFNLWEYCNLCNGTFMQYFLSILRR